MKEEIGGGKGGEGRPKEGARGKNDRIEEGGGSERGGKGVKERGGGRGEGGGFGELSGTGPPGASLDVGD